MQAFSPNRRPYLLFRVALLGLVVVVGGLAYLADPMNLWELAVLVAAIALAVLGILFSGPVSLVATAGLVLCLWGTYLGLALTATATPLPALTHLAAWTLVLAAAGLLPSKVAQWFAAVLAENQLMRHRVETLVSSDPDSGLDNEHRFHRELAEEFSRARRYGQPLTLLLIRIAFYPEFRQFYGDDEAAHLVRRVGQVIRNNTRLSDAKFRLGQDTFAVILTNTETARAYQVLRNITPLLEDHQLLNAPVSVKLTIASGIAGYEPSLADHVDMLQRAYEELYHYVE